ncbi:hypothetical protein [Kitasatospora indigofera]
MNIEHAAMRVPPEVLKIAVEPANKASRWAATDEALFHAVEATPEPAAAG